MKHSILLFALSLLLGTSFTISAQDYDPFYDYENLELTSATTIPDFETKEDKLKITGTIYESDGVTPAKDVILYIEQADEHGDFDVRKTNNSKYVHHRAWVKTDENGNYTFYTFVPGNDRRYNQMQQLFPVIKEPNKQAYEVASFLFDDDPLLTKLCRKRMEKKGDISRILKLKKENGIYVTHKDIVLHDLDASE